MQHILRTIRRPGVAKRIALIDSTGGKQTYEQLLHRSVSLAHVLKSKNIKEPTIACFQKANSNYVVTMLATWMIGKRFLPLCTTHPEAELKYFIDDSRAGAIVFSSHDTCSKHSYGALPQLGVPLIDSSSSTSPMEGGNSDVDYQVPDFNSDALILYTSGTTGRPKGVVHSHHGVTSMVDGLVQSWEYSQNDHILHFLPLHHLHGVLNKLLCMVYVGGCVEFLSSAHAGDIWKRLAADGQPSVSLFMAVPTIYARMIEFAQDAAKSGDVEKKAIVESALAAVRRDTRLMACGSAALPDNVMTTWYKLTGQVLLERYGMTEGGMLLSNAYLPISSRTPGHVGTPLPHVTVRLVDDSEKEIAGSHSAASAQSGTSDEPGELRVKGPTVFREYLNRPEAYNETFDSNGWFKTGDIAVRKENGMYAILGRNSTDIIKCKGYKLSALEVERELLAMEIVKEVAVIGRPHPMDGETVVAIVVVHSDKTRSDDQCTAQLKEFLKTKLAHYKLPSRYIYVESLPRNALGKVGKKTLWKDLQLGEE